METWFPTFRRLLDTRIRLPSLWPTYTTAGQRRSLLRVIAVGIEENVPIVPLLECWSQDEWGAQRARLRRLTRLLKNGRSLADAIEDVPGLLRDEDVLALRFDTQSGTRTAAVREILDEPVTHACSQGPRIRRPLIYLGIMAPVYLLFFAFVQLRIAPVFIKMFDEFGLRRPEVLNSAANLSGLMLNFWWLAALAGLVLGALLLSTRGSRFLRDSVLGRWFESRRQSRAGDVLQNIGVAVQAGRPIPGALSTLARYHFDPAMRHQLLFVRNELEQGAEVWPSMKAVGLLTPQEVRLLSTAERVGNRGWVLAQLAQVKKRRARLSTQRWIEFLLPLVVIVIGGFVLFQSLTVLEPLIKLIKGWL